LKTLSYSIFSAASGQNQGTGRKSGETFLLDLPEEGSAARRPERTQRCSSNHHFQAKKMPELRRFRSLLPAYRFLNGLLGPTFTSGAEHHQNRPRSPHGGSRGILSSSCEARGSDVVAAGEGDA